MGKGSLSHKDLGDVKIVKRIPDDSDPFIIIYRIARGVEPHQLILDRASGIMMYYDASQIFTPIAPLFSADTTCEKFCTSF